MSTPQKVGFVSLGCPKALVDSERILTQLRFDGYEVSPSYEDAGVVIVNTCGFIDSAKEESLEAIGEALEENGRVLVTGCMGAKDQADLVLQRHPKVLGITGPAAYEEVLTEVRRVLPNQRTPDPKIDLIPSQGVKLTPRHYAYLKISEGCNHRCRFCIIPSLRGDLVSRPIGEVMTEAEQLARSGVKELLVISQDTSAYGVDLKYKTDFWNGKPLKSNLESLASALSELGIWVRLHYVYPYPHVDELLPLMADGKLLPYLDIPFQHASNRVLKAMRRPAAEARTLERIESWRKQVPDLTIRSTLPGVPVPQAAGLFIGSTSTLMGIGGGVTNNVFMSLCGVDIKRAIATSAGVGVIISIPATAGFMTIGWTKDGLPPLSLGYVNLIALALMIPFTIYMAPIGARLTHRLDGRLTKRLFSLFLIVVALRTFWKAFAA